MSTVIIKIVSWYCTSGQTDDHYTEYWRYHDHQTIVKDIGLVCYVE